MPNDKPNPGKGKKPGTIQVTPLGTAQTASAPANWAAFQNISLKTGDCLIIGGGSILPVNEVSWAGHPMEVGCMSAGAPSATSFSTSIVFYFAQANESGSVVVDVPGGSNPFSLFATKVTGLMVPFHGFITSDNTTDPGPTVSDRPTFTGFESGILVGLTGSNAISLGIPSWENGWTEGQEVEQAGASVVEGFKIIDVSESSEAKISNLPIGAYQTCHMGFRAI